MLKPEYQKVGEGKSVTFHVLHSYFSCVRHFTLLNHVLREFLRRLRNDRYFQVARANRKETHVWLFVPSAA